MKKIFLNRSEYQLSGLVSDIFVGVAILVLLTEIAYYLFHVIHSTIAIWFANANTAEVVVF